MNQENSRYGGIAPGSKLDTGAADDRIAHVRFDSERLLKPSGDLQITVSNRDKARTLAHHVQSVPACLAPWQCGGFSRSHAHGAIPWAGTG